MAEFKPMVKMETTEPSVILKLKNGGHVNMNKGGKAENGHEKMADGGAPISSGALQALMQNPALVGRPAVNALVRNPGKPSMAARRAAMMAPRRPAPTMAAAGPSAMPGTMKKGGKAEGGKSDVAEDKAMIKKAFKQHDTQEHKGAKGTKLALQKGGSALAGPQKGGVKENDSVRTDATTRTTTAKTDPGYEHYKKGGNAKKAFAAGGKVESGAPAAMPQGSKKATSPVRISQLAGTYKDGGNVEDMSKGAYDKFYAEQKADNEDMSNAILGFPGRIVDKVKSLFSTSKPAGSVTKTEKSVTVAPGKKNGGKC